ASLRRPAAQQKVHLVVAVQVVLVGPATKLHALQQLLGDIGISGRCSQRRQPVKAREDAILDSARLDLTRPANDRRYAEATFENRTLGGSKWRHTAVRPGEDFRAIVGGEDDNRVVGFADVLQVL